MKKLAIAVYAVFFVFSGSAIVHAIPWTEGPDAGALIDSAQVARGPKTLEYIAGSLTGNDVDLYQIWINDTSEFSATVWADLSYNDSDKFDDNDAVLYLFDAQGFKVLEDDDNGDGLLPQFNSGQIFGEDKSIYYLAFVPFGTYPLSDLLVGWHLTTSPQTGDYTLTLTGASPAAHAPVPEPATILLLGSGLIGLAATRKRFMA